MHLLHRVAKPAIEWRFGGADRLHRRCNVLSLQVDDRERPAAFPGAKLASRLIPAARRAFSYSSRREPLISSNASRSISSLPERIGSAKATAAICPPWLRCGRPSSRRTSATWPLDFGDIPTSLRPSCRSASRPCPRGRAGEQQKELLGFHRVGVGFHAKRYAETVSRTPTIRMKLSAPQSTRAGLREPSKARAKSLQSRLQRFDSGRRLSLYDAKSRILGPKTPIPRGPLRTAEDRCSPALTGAQTGARILLSLLSIAPKTLWSQFERT